jgi:hypothetical protein
MEQRHHFLGYAVSTLAQLRLDELDRMKNERSPSGGFVESTNQNKSME